MQKYKSNFQCNQTEELSKCNAQLEMSIKDLETAANHFQKLHEELEAFSCNEIKKDVELNVSERSDSNISEYDKFLFMPSPSIQINNCFEGTRNMPLNDFKLTPIEGTYIK